MVSTTGHSVRLQSRSRAPQTYRPQGRFSSLLVSLMVLLCVTASAQRSDSVPGRILVKPKGNLSEVEFARRIHSRGAIQHRALHRTNVRVLSVAPGQTDSVLKALRQDPDIDFAEPDYVAHACATANDPYAVSGAEWHLSKIQAFQAWDYTIGATNVVIAVLDSGVNAAHPDLAGHVLPGYDFVNSDAEPIDDFGHGTAVTGTLVAAGNNGIGVAGVAYGCTVLPVKVMDAWGSASHSTIAQGIEYAIQQGAQIINLSLGGDWSSSTLQNAINDAWSNNVVIVAAAGNNGSTVPQYPGACDHVLAVAASEPDDTRCWFSSYGSYVGLYAPGDSIWTTQRDLNNPYAAWSGTSFSSPIVAAVAGLVLAGAPSLSNSQLIEVLKQTSDDLGDPGYDPVFAYGRVNAFRAVSAVTSISPSSSTTTNLAPSPPPQDLPPTPPPSDVVPPSIMIRTSPPNGARLYSPAVTLAGTANDNLGLDHVEIQLNDQPSQKAEGTTNWSAQLTLRPGYNLVRAWSVDLAGNGSLAQVRAFTYVLTTPLIVQTNGWGGFAPNLNGQFLEIGRTYHLHAVPGPGQVFAGWTGAIASPAATLTFQMQSNLALTANFVPNPFPAVRGSYAGLMLNSNGVTSDNSGYLSFRVTSSGYLSGHLSSAGQRFGFSGRLNLSGDSTVTVRRGLSAPLALALHVNLTNGSSQATGSLTDGNWTSELACDRNVFNPWMNPPPQAGVRSFILQRAQDETEAATGSSRISLSGSTSVRGSLSDGRRFSTASALARNGDSPFYLSFNHGNEVVIGWLNFPSGQGPLASGTVLWVRSGTNAFATTLQAAPGQ